MVAAHTSAWCVSYIETRTTCMGCLQKLMIKLEVKATPTFFLYRDQHLGSTLTGINENNLRNAIIDFGHPSDQDIAPLE